MDDKDVKPTLEALAADVLALRDCFEQLLADHMLQHAQPNEALVTFMNKVCALAKLQSKQNDSVGVADLNRKVMMSLDAIATAALARIVTHRRTLRH
jgi:hypothetical protein